MRVSLSEGSLSSSQTELLRTTCSGASGPSTFRYNLAKAEFLSSFDSSNPSAISVPVLGSLIVRTLDITPTPFSPDERPVSLNKPRDARCKRRITH